MSQRLNFDCVQATRYSFRGVQEEALRPLAAMDEAELCKRRAGAALFSSTHV